MLVDNQKATVLSAESKPYDIDGNKGVSHKVRLFIKDSIFPAKADEQSVINAKQHVGKEVTVDLNFTSIKEKPDVSLVRIHPTK